MCACVCGTVCVYVSSSPSSRPSSSPVVSEESSPPHGTDTASATDESTNDQMVTIHVFDDAKNGEY